MSVADVQDLAIEVFGGLCTQISPADLPAGVSPDCQDVSFQEGEVKTRPGLTSQYTLAGNPTVNYLKTYLNLQETARLLSLDSLGVLRKDPTPGGGPLSVISSALLTGLFGKSTTLFGREYIALGDGVQGVDLPRQYDDTNLDRISQVGPGQAPSASDENLSFPIVAPGAGVVYQAAFGIQAGPTGLTEVNNLVTVVLPTLGTFNGLQLGDSFVIAGAGVAAYNGTWVIGSMVVVNGFTALQFVHPTAGLAASGGGTVDLASALVTTTAANNFVAGQSVALAGVTVAAYNGTYDVRTIIAPTQFTVKTLAFGLANSGNGTASPGGNIPAGEHQLSVLFVTRNNYFTKPAPPNSWIASGAKRAVVANIPVGPPNVIARILCFTAAGGSSFYHLGPTGTTIFSSNMYIADNTTTSVTVDFSDGVLQLGTLDDPLFRLIELPEVAGVLDYAERMFAWGELNLVQGFNNLSFDGGFSNPGLLPNFPLGWTLDSVFSPGGASAVAQGTPPFFGDAYQIFGNGVTATRGLITQNAAVNYLSNPILQPNTAYTVRARIQVNALAAAGTIHVNLKSATLGITTAGISLAWNALTQSYNVYTGNLTPGLASIPSDLVLQVYADGTPNQTAIFSIKAIEVYPTAVPTNGSNVRASGTGDANNGTAESFDFETGLITISENNGQGIRAAFKLRERLYFVKEHSFFVTQDDGVSQPSGWTLDEVSSRVGTPSVNGVGGSYSQSAGEDWVVIAHRTGLYLFWGGEPVKICPEIQPTWDTINWQYGSTISVAVDTRKRRVYICAPFGEAIKPNGTLVLDYHDVGGAEQIASMEPVKLSFSGRKIVSDKARKWCPWTIPANCVAQIEQPNAQSQIYFGSNDGSGHINLLDENALNDNGSTIPSYYITAAFPDLSVEEPLKLRSHRKLFTYLTLYVTGSGTLGVTSYPSSLTNAIALNPFTLSNPLVGDLEMGLNFSIERAFFKFSSGGLNQWFSLQRCCVCVKPEPWSIVRGA
jgi:hypothetical protein